MPKGGAAGHADIRDRGKAGDAGRADKASGSVVRSHGRLAVTYGDGYPAMSEHSSDASAAKSRRNRTAAKAADRKSVRTDGRTKATLLLPDSVDFRLTTIAASLKSTAARWRRN